VVKWYGYVVHMEGNRRHKRIMAWSAEGRRQRGRPEVKWDKEVESVMNQRNVACDEAVNWQLWRLKTSNQWPTRKLIYR
jgi:hypothetical protein